MARSGRFLEANPGTIVRPMIKPPVNADTRLPVLSDKAHIRYFYGSSAVSGTGTGAGVIIWSARLRAGSCAGSCTRSCAGRAEVRVGGPGEEVSPGQCIGPRKLDNKPPMIRGSLVKNAGLAGDTAEHGLESTGTTRRERDCFLTKIS